LRARCSGTVKELGGNGGPEYLADGKNIARNGAVTTPRPTSSPNPPPRRGERSQTAFGARESRSESADFTG